jgi:hypothetical protein
LYLRAFSYTLPQASGPLTFLNIQIKMFMQ